MSDLTQKVCKSCEFGAAPMEADLVVKMLEEIPGWELSESKNAVARQFEFKDFLEAMVFVNKVAEIAESEGHHPDMAINWNKVSLSNTTHSMNGLSENDFILAAKINQLS